MLKVWHCPGHGGDNKGLEHQGFIEREWVLELALDLVCVSTGPCTIAHEFARTTDETIEYRDRAKAASGWGADLVLCHHVDGIFYDGDKDRPNQTHDGLRTFVDDGDVIGYRVASAISRAAPSRLQRRSAKPVVATAVDWTRDAHAIVREYTKLGMPTVLIEWGFATSPNDRSLLLSPHSRVALLVAAYAGIARMVEIHGV